MLEDYIPSYVLQNFEQHQGGRTGMRELAVLAAAWEDVAHGEAVPLLSTAYSAQGRHTADTPHGVAGHRIVTTDLLFHDMPDPVFAQLGIDGPNTLPDDAPTFSRVWPNMVTWTQDLRDALKYSVTSQRNPVVDEIARSRDFYRRRR